MTPLDLPRREETYPREREEKDPNPPHAKVQSHKSHANLARDYSDKELVFIEMVEENQVSLLLVRHHMDR
jgi:hypothetical protein